MHCREGGKLERLLFLNRCGPESVDYQVRPQWGVSSYEKVLVVVLSHTKLDDPNSMLS